MNERRFVTDSAIGNISPPGDPSVSSTEVVVASSSSGSDLASSKGEVQVVVKKVR